MFQQEIISRIASQFKKKGQSLAIAESVTSGLVQAACSQAKDASHFFQGGITAYNLGQKSRHLLVDPLHAQQCNCVSEQVAESMACQVSVLFSSHWGLGITGYAATMPEQGVDELFAYYAVYQNGEKKDGGRIDGGKEEGLKAQLHYVHTLLERLEACLQKGQKF
jgi:nicotinamide-nucleotide amidase